MRRRRRATTPSFRLEVPRRSVSRGAGGDLGGSHVRRQLPKSHRYCHLPVGPLTVEIASPQSVSPRRSETSAKSLLIGDTCRDSIAVPDASSVDAVRGRSHVSVGRPLRLHCPRPSVAAGLGMGSNGRIPRDSPPMDGPRGCRHGRVTRQGGLRSHRLQPPHPLVSRGTDAANPHPPRTSNSNF